MSEEGGLTGNVSEEGGLTGKVCVVFSSPPAARLAARLLSARPGPAQSALLPVQAVLVFALCCLQGLSPW